MVGLRVSPALVIPNTKWRLVKIGDPQEEEEEVEPPKEKQKKRNRNSCNSCKTCENFC